MYTYSEFAFGLQQISKVLKKGVNKKAELLRKKKDYLLRAARNKKGGMADPSSLAKVIGSSRTASNKAKDSFRSKLSRKIQKVDEKITKSPLGTDVKTIPGRIKDRFRARAARKDWDRMNKSSRAAITAQKRSNKRQKQASLERRSGRTTPYNPDPITGALAA